MPGTAPARSHATPAETFPGPLTGLRVVDASIMPATVRANTHLTTLMIAEKVSDGMIASERAA